MGNRGGGVILKTTTTCCCERHKYSSVLSHLPIASLALFFASPESMVFASISFSDIADKETMLMAIETAAKELTQ